MKFYLFLVFIFVAIDQVSKEIARRYLTPESYIELIPNLIHLTYKENKGVSLSLFSTLPDIYRVPFLVGVSSIVIIGIFIYLYKHWEQTPRSERWGFALILGGAIGNLIDRAIFQSVVDFMYFHFYQTGFFVNNIADDFISIGFVILLISDLTKGNKSDEKEETT